MITVRPLLIQFHIIYIYIDIYLCCMNIFFRFLSLAVLGNMQLRNANILQHCACKQQLHENIQTQTADWLNRDVAAVSY